VILYFIGVLVVNLTSGICASHPPTAR